MLSLAKLSGIFPDIERITTILKTQIKGIHVKKDVAKWHTQVRLYGLVPYVRTYKPITQVE